MKKMTIKKMTGIEGGSNRQCLIDGALTMVLIGAGAAMAGLWGAIGGLAAGLGMGNSNGCFEK